MDVQGKEEEWDKTNDAHAPLLGPNHWYGFKVSILFS